MRKAFSFIEVLVSIAILSFMGVALIKFNSFNKRSMEKSIITQESVLISSSMLFERKIDNNKEVELFDLVKFKSLDDEDRKFLKSIKLKQDREIEDKLFLGSTEKENLYVEYGGLNIEYKGHKQNYLWLQKE